jgi:hypothetical protein
MTPKRPRGRPPIDPSDRSVPYSVKIPAKDFAQAETRAKDERLTLADWIRRMLRASGRDPGPD